MTRAVEGLVDLAQDFHVRGLVLDRAEDERRQFAENLHDDPLQTIIAANMHLEILRRAIGDPARAHEEIDNVAELHQRAIQQLRTLIFELSPSQLWTGGLYESICEYAKPFDGVDGPTVEVNVVGAQSSWLPPEAIAACYRVASEAISNAVRHSGAKRVDVVLASSEHAYRIQVTDDGRGFAVDLCKSRPGHLGLSAMSERARRSGASFAIESRPGVGTTVSMEIQRRPPGSFE